jgi:hypothetical protein
MRWPDLSRGHTPGCSVLVSHQFYGAGKTAKDSKSTGEYIDLADLNPAGVRLQVSHDEGYSSNEVDFERSDAATKIV